MCETCGASRGHYLRCAAYLSWVHRHRKPQPKRPKLERASGYQEEAAIVWRKRLDSIGSDQ